MSRLLLLAHSRTTRSIGRIVLGDCLDLAGPRTTPPGNGISQHCHQAATDIRVNQQQVIAAGRELVSTGPIYGTPVNGERRYVEYEMHEQPSRRRA
jgi:hypothetical protein